MRGMISISDVFHGVVLSAGFEPATHGLEIRCSIHLSYGSIIKIVAPAGIEPARPLRDTGFSYHYSFHYH